MKQYKQYYILNIGMIAATNN